MKGDLMYLDGRWCRVVSETPITVHMEETDRQARERERAGGHAQTFQYTAVRTELVPMQEPWEDPDEDEIVTIRI